MVLGVLSSLLFTRFTRNSASLAISLAVLPSIVTLVIMMVNGNIGAGLAVAGTFAMVRFRSAVGSAKEITGLFFSVAIGLACGMGYVGLAAIFFVFMAVVTLFLALVRFGESEGEEKDYVRDEKEKHITLTENGVNKAEQYFQNSQLDELEALVGRKFDIPDEQ